MNILYRFLKLKTKEKQLLIKTIILMWSVRIMVWLFPFKYIQKIMPKHVIRQTDKKSIPVEMLTWAVEVASNYVINSTCFVKAITGQILFSNENYPSELKIGVAKDDNEFEAHAWLEIEDKLVIGIAEREYITILEWNCKLNES